MSFLQRPPTVLHRIERRNSKHDNQLSCLEDRTLTRKRTASLRQRSSESSLSALVRIIQDPANTIGNLVQGFRDGLTVEERSEKMAVEKRKQILYARRKNAIEFEEWHSASAELDRLEGNDEWKSDPTSTDFDAALVESRLKQLDDVRLSCDLSRMLFHVRTSLTRELGDMGNIRLYKRSHIGTKHLIERYIDSALETLHAILTLSARGQGQLDSKYILEQMLSARQAFGRSALLLSGGATYGMNHIGVLKCLWELKLLPRIISGASAGSIVCAVLCTQTDEQMPELLERFPYGDLSVFEATGNEDGILTRVARLLKVGAWIDISHLMRVMKDMLGDMTFQEAYNRTRRILNICVSSASVYELPRLLNYVTAPNVLIWSAVAASCSVPFLFTSASIYAKDPRTGQPVPWNPSPQRWIDGSVDNDLPMTRLAEMFNVNHFIVSQVNPHVVPFLVKEDGPITADAQQDTHSTGFGSGWYQTTMELAKAEAMHRMHVLADLGIFPNTLTKARSVLSQKYSGDITIFPEISFADFPKMLKNPTVEFMQHAMLCGERATWPKLSRIRNHCAIELALDNAVQELRARVVFSPSQVDLRLNSFGNMTGSASNLNIDANSRPRGRTRRNRRRVSHGSSPSDLPALTPSIEKHPAQTQERSAQRSSWHAKTSSADSTVKPPTPVPTKLHQRRRNSPHPPIALKIPPPPTFHPSSDFTSSTSGAGDDSTPPRYFSTSSDDPDHLNPDSSPSESSSPTTPQQKLPHPDSPSYFRPHPHHHHHQRGASTPNADHLFPYASQPATPRAWGLLSHHGAAALSSLTPNAGSTREVSPVATRRPSPAAAGEGRTGGFGLGLALALGMTPTSAAASSAGAGGAPGGGSPERKK